MTTYVDRVLEPSETVRYRTTVSWIVYVPSLLLAFMAAMFLLAAGSNPAGDVIAALGALAAISNFLSAWFRRWTPKLPSLIGASSSNTGLSAEPLWK